MKLTRFVLVSAIVLGTIAIAATQYTKLLNLQVTGLTLLGTTNESNAIKSSIVADVDYNFASATIVCNDTPASPAPGVKPGNPCDIGVGPRDGGVQSVVSANSVFFAFSDAVDTVKVRHCAVGTAIDPPDSGFVVRCFNAPGQ